MNVLWHWVPTFGASAILLIVALVLLAKVKREEREAERRRTGKPPTGPAGAP